MTDQKIVNVLFKKNYHDAQLPLQAHPGDAGLDLYCHDVQKWLYPNSMVIIDCGFSMAMPEGWEAQIRPRSGMAVKKGITVLNSPGTVDSGYRGPIKVCLINHSTRTHIIKRGNRIAQMVISEIPFVDVEAVEELPESVRGESGFGSSGD